MNQTPLLYKMSGTGNTIIVISATAQSEWQKWESNQKQTRVALVRLLCQKTYGVAADGVLFLQEGVDGADFCWDFYNADGSQAEMCGNAARCAGRFVFEKLNLKKKKIIFSTVAGQIEVTNLDAKKPQVQMTAPKLIKENLQIQVGQEKLQGMLVNTGVPHFVIMTKIILQDDKMRTLARQLRQHDVFSPSGANITFVQQISKSKVKAVTYERGVEDFTLSCGTGAVAAAFSQHHQQKENEIQVEMPGGQLQVIFNRNNQDSPILEGEAAFILEFKIFIGEIK